MNQCAKQLRQVGSREFRRYQMDDKTSKCELSDLGLAELYRFILHDFPRQQLEQEHMEGKRSKGVKEKTRPSPITLDHPSERSAKPLQKGHLQFSANPLLQVIRTRTSVHVGPTALLHPTRIPLTPSPLRPPLLYPICPTLQKRKRRHTGDTLHTWKLPQTRRINFRKRVPKLAGGGLCQ
ncbi:hypothetical protein BT69DRAFT_827104 [Atractiella rhizophila]|nr:hypothetical protein BT69DRAFT_827104 [Atractiella rhizophila]